MTPYYAQKNYPEFIDSSNETIAEVGCLLTAFCNLILVAEKFRVNPEALNEWFKGRGIYIGDELGWESVCAYRPFAVSIHSLPVTTSTWAIVRLNPSWGTHFCLVHSVVKGVVNIVDSYDGMIKPSSVYGKIDQWAAYTPIKPQAKAVYKG